MCLPRTGRWVDALRHTLCKVYEPMNRAPLPWVLTGEAAMSLQGVDIDPEAIEFRAFSPYAVAYFSGFMKPYESPANAATVIYRRGGNDAPSESWRSNVHQRIVAWNTLEQYCWFGRWNVDGFPVEVLHAQYMLGDTLADISRDDIRRVHYEGMGVAVAPLEYLLADSARQGQTPVTNRILHVLRTGGYDTDVLSRALDSLPSEQAMRLLRLLEIRLVAG